MLLLLLMFDLLSCSNADIFSLVVPDGVSGQLGSSVVLPCSLSPPLDCKSCEIHWYGPNDKNNLILLYKDLKVQENTGDTQYRGRVSLIGELQKGKVSLRLENLTVADRGEYVCHVESYQWYEKASVFLSLPVVGSLPVLSFAGAGEEVNVTCTSGGWSPKPTLTWRDKGGRELTDSVNHDYTDSEGLVSVSSWLLFSPSESEWISCSVGLSGQEMRESRVLPLKPDPPTEPGVSPGWKVATILLVISLLLLTVMTVFFFLKFRGHIFQKGTKSTPAEEEARPLVADLSPPSCPVCAAREINRNDGDTQTSGPETANKETNTYKEKQGSKTASKKEKNNKTTTKKQGRQTANKRTSQEKERQGEVSPPSNPTYDQKENIRPEGAAQASDPDPDTQGTSTDQGIQDSVKNDTESETPDWEKMLSRKVAIKPVPSESNQAVLFKERIRSGQYFWRVTGLTRESQTVPNMYECPKFWYVGVTNDTAADKRKAPLTPQNGYWVLYYNEESYYVNDPSLTPVLVREQFADLGVFVDCEKQTLSFYDCDKQTHLYTFYDVPSTTPLIPVLYPGLKPRYSLKISQELCVKCDELYLQH